MRWSVMVFTAVLACGSAIQPSSGNIRSKALNDLKSTLEKIKADILNMKPSIRAAAGLVDAYIPQHIEDTPKSIDDAFVQLNEKNIPDECLQEAQTKLNTLRDVVVPNCSAIHIVEDAGALTYNTANFVALSMVTLDDVLGGLDQCSPWYKFWHYVPCVLTYAWTSYSDLTGIITEAFKTFKENEQRMFDIAHQLVCKTNQVSALSLSSTQVMNEAYLCAKNSKKAL
uniref:Pyrrolidone-carboxylate peptidase n=1 Tax=Lygus hesperus TaxID=30085 RepID=A0A0A9WW21_LYGHE